LTATPDLVLRSSFTSSDERHYTEVPFEVPIGVRSLHVEYDYSERISSDPRLSGGNTLDIGLFDPHGFRGWSGSHKLAFSVSETWATPAYLHGPIASGIWRILLGPYKVAPRGCDYEVRITFSGAAGEPPFDEPRQVVAQPPVGLSAPAETGWLRGDLHCHTLYSDGDSWPADMLSEAVERGLDFLGVTDHNQMGHQAAYARIKGNHLPLILPGIEVTTYGGHWNAWGTDRWWDFRQPTEAATTAVIQAAAASGAVVSVNHPKPFGPPWQYPNAVGFHAVEVWNGNWPEANEVSLAWWDSLLRAGRRVVAVGGSDTHHLKRAGDRPGRPTTWVQVGGDRSVSGVLSALRAGRVFVSRDVDGPQLFLWRDHLRVLDARGATLTLVSDRGVERSSTVASDDWTTSIALESAYVRAELRDASGEMLALSNPV
jgi:hypothetical protein